MVATLWLLSLLTVTLIRASECIYATPPLVKYRRLDNIPYGIQVSNFCSNIDMLQNFKLFIFECLRKNRFTIKTSFKMSVDQNETEYGLYSKSHAFAQQFHFALIRTLFETSF